MIKKISAFIAILLVAAATGCFIAYDKQQNQEQELTQRHITQFPAIDSAGYGVAYEFVQLRSRIDSLESRVRILEDNPTIKYYKPAKQLLERK